MASGFRYYRLIHSYWSETAWWYIVEIKTDGKNSELSPIGIQLSSKALIGILDMWNPNLEAFLQSEVVISSKITILVLSQVTKQQGFLTSCEWAYHIASESKTD